MKGLVIDTTLKKGYVAAFDGERESVVLLDPTLSTQSGLIPACRSALLNLGMVPADLEGIAAVVGPGSFTGIRIGVSFANAMAFALGLPRFSLTSFDVMRFLRPDAPAYAIDAGHGEVYAAFPQGGSLVQENRIAEDLPRGALDQTAIENDLPRGALLACRKALEERDFSACAPTFEREYLKPNYMRKSQAERLKEGQK